MSAQFNAFENALDFSFWRELCEKHGTLRHFKRGEYFARTGKFSKKPDGLCQVVSSIR